MQILERENGKKWGEAGSSGIMDEAEKNAG